MAFANKIAVNASLQDFKASFQSIIAVEGCRTGCANQLLSSMGFEPASTLYLSEKWRADEKVGLTAEEDAQVEGRVLEVAQQIVALAPEE